MISTLHASFAQDMSEVEIKATKLTEHIYMLQGRGGNIGLIKSDKEVMLIDDQYAPLSEKITTAIKSITPLPITYIINTHYHGDHVGGNVNFAHAGSIIISHKNVRERVSTEQVNKFRNSTTPPMEEMGWPVITFEKDLTVYIGKEEVYMVKTENAHTDGDAIIYFKNSNIIHAGDAFVTYGYPYIDSSAGGTLTGMIALNESILSIIDENTVIIPGHGNLCKKEDLQLFVNRLKEIKSILLEGIRAGKDSSTLIQEEVLSKFDKDWGNGFIKAKDMITLVYDELLKLK